MLKAVGARLRQKHLGRGSVSQGKDLLSTILSLARLDFYETFRKHDPLKPAIGVGFSDLE
jgi:hypothetical protein